MTAEPGSTRGGRDVIATSSAPDAIGPYNQGIRVGELLFCSGMLPLDPQSGELVSGSLADQTRRCLRNLEAVCEAAGTGLSRAVQLTIYTTVLTRFAEINDAYAEFFPSDPPARAAVGVQALPLGAELEIAAIVAVG